MSQANGRPSVVLLKSPYSRYEEGRAGGTVKPGHLVDFTSTAGQLVVHATAAGTNVRPRFATEELHVLIGKTIADSYASGDLFSYREFNEGDKIQAWIKTGVNAARGAKLESAGDGQLQALTTGKAVAQADEAVDATAGAKQISVTIL